MSGILAVLIFVATALALRSMVRLWRTRQQEMAIGRDDGSRPWLLTRVVILCGGATLVGLWLSILSTFALTGIRFPFSPPISYLIGVVVTLLPTYIAWDILRHDE